MRHAKSLHSDLFIDGNIHESTQKMIDDTFPATDHSIPFYCFNCEPSPRFPNRRSYSSHLEAIHNINLLNVMEEFTNKEDVDNFLRVEGLTYWWEYNHKKVYMCIHNPDYRSHNNTETTNKKVRRPTKKFPVKICPAYVEITGLVTKTGTIYSVEGSITHLGHEAIDEPDIRPEGIIFPANEIVGLSTQQYAVALGHTASQQYISNVVKKNQDAARLLTGMHAEDYDLKLIEEMMMESKEDFLR